MKGEQKWFVMGAECCERELRKENLQHHGFIEIENAENERERSGIA